MTEPLLFRENYRLYYGKEVLIVATSIKDMNREDLKIVIDKFVELGYQAYEIAGILNLSESTVRAYINY